MAYSFSHKFWTGPLHCWRFAMYIVNPICGWILSQHALEDYTIKFESNSFRILLSARYNSFQVIDAVEDADEVSRLSQSQKSEGIKLCQTFLK